MFCPCSHKRGECRQSKMKKLSRAEIKEALSQIPVEQILGSDTSKELTSRQKKFAMEVAKGATKADAYRASYAGKSKHTIVRQPYILARDPRIQKEIKAYELAIEAAKYRTPAALRELVIQSLVEVLIDEDAKEAVRVQAAKVLGTVTEVAAFTERKEVRTIKSADDARAHVMAQIRELVQAQAVDAVEVDADSLMSELSGNVTTRTDVPMQAGDPMQGGNVTTGTDVLVGGGSAENGEEDTHYTPTPPSTETESHPLIHTTPDK